jgi:glycerate kinase
MREAGAQRVVLGIGGTMTVEGGATVAAGFGAIFRNGDEVITAKDVFDAARATTVSLPQPWTDIDVECWCDVRTPLLGASGGVVTFAPQKGASDDDVAALETAVTAWTRHLTGQTSITPNDPGTGAGGGIPFGVAICTGARLRHGPPALLDLVDFTAAIANADLVWTGEGRVDATTAEGKLVSEVLQRAQQQGRSVTIFAGQVQPGAESALAPGDLVSLSGPQVTVERSMADAEPLLEIAAESWLGNWIEKKT